jgi:anti-sigma-K factor RskA
MSQHEQVDQLLAGFALGGISDSEARLVRGHLRECDICAGNLSAMADVVGAMPLSVEAVQPPDSLRERVLAIPQARRRGLPFLPRPPRSLPALFPSRPALGYAWAAAAILVVALGTWNLALTRQLADTNSRVSQLQAQVQRGSLVGPANASVGSVAYLGRDQLAIVSFHALATPRSGREYQLWVVDSKGRAESVGVFLPEPDGRKLLVLNRQVAGSDTFAVTDEPFGGSYAPTTTPFITGHI